MGMLTQFLPQLGDPIPPKATASKPAATSAPAKPPAAVTDSQKPLAPMAQKAMEAIVNFNEESNPAAVRTLASVYLAPQWSQLDSAGQQTVVDTLMQRAKAFRGKTSSLGSGAMAGGISGSVVGDALAPETGGLSMLIPVLASAVGGGAGNAVEQKLTTGKINPKAMAIAGAEQGGGELAGQGLQSGAKALMTSAFGVKALSAADRAIGDISERFGLGAGAPEIGGRFRRLVELFGSNARTKGIQDAAAMAASKQLSSLGA
ncbi:MAG TPA: hypothetical protein VNL71_00910, partial [Chloroflexota bacterium]|nr:hypothetical protein [Chloroflexota bacterium]